MIAPSSSTRARRACESAEDADIFSPSCRRTTLGLAIACWAAAGEANAQAPSRHGSPWNRQVSLAWREQQLGDALLRLSETQRFALWIDRRVDRSARVNLVAEGLTVGNVLDSLASQHDAAVVQFRGVMYFGPTRTAAALPQLASRAGAEIGKLPRPVQAKWRASSVWKCSRLSEPRALIGEIAIGLGGNVANEDLIPHDLWPAKEIPAMAPADRLVLLLANFDLTFDVSDGGRTIRLKPIDYSRLNAPKPPQRVAGVQAPQSRTAQPRGAGDRRFTLKIVNQPAGRVIEQLAARLGLSVVWEASPQGSDSPEGRTLVSCDVRGATLEQLLAAILDPAGLRADIHGTELTLKSKVAPE